MKKIQRLLGVASVPIREYCLLLHGLDFPHGTELQCSKLSLFVLNTG